MDFNAVFTLLIGDFQREEIDFAIIGAFALHAAGCMRATNDIDFLVAKEDMPKVKRMMLSYGYELLHESQDVSNFLGKMAELGKVDFFEVSSGHGGHRIDNKSQCWDARYRTD
jgi:hypothetical protein